MVANLAWVLKVWHGIFITLFTRFTSICELCLQLENLKSYILRFLSSSVVVMVMFLPPMRKACIPSFERKKTAKELLTIWVKGFQFQNLSTWHGAFINRNKYSKKKNIQDWQIRVRVFACLQEKFREAFFEKAR